jgi:NAD+ kinase
MVDKQGVMSYDNEVPAMGHLYKEGVLRQGVPREALERGPSESENRYSPSEIVVKAIAIFFQGRKQDTSEVANQLIPALERQGYEVRGIDSRYEGEETPDPLIKGCDLALVLGGDGTILHAARLCAYADLPIVAVNFGRVGFLTELEPGEVLEELPHYLKREDSVWIDERIMLHATLDQDGHCEEFLALNDVVVARGMWPRLVDIQIWVDDHLYNKTYADGIIVSTATGSTAYNMSVGGPLLHPQVQSIVLSPIAPHLVSGHSLILPPDTCIKLKIFTGSQDGVFSADGQMNRVIKNGAMVTVQKSQYITRFLRRRPPTYFYQKIHAKLRDEVKEIILANKYAT